MSWPWSLFRQLSAPLRVSVGQAGPLRLYSTPRAHAGPAGRDRWVRGKEAPRGQSWAVGNWLGPGVSHHFKHTGFIRRLFHWCRKTGKPAGSMDAAQGRVSAGSSCLVGWVHTEEGCSVLPRPQGSCWLLQGLGPGPGLTRCVFFKAPVPPRLAPRGPFFSHLTREAGAGGRDLCLLFCRSTQRAPRAHGGCGKDGGAGGGADRRGANQTQKAPRLPGPEGRERPPSGQSWFQGVLPPGEAKDAAGGG